MIRLIQEVVLTASHVDNHSWVVGTKRKLTGCLKALNKNGKQYFDCDRPDQPRQNSTNRQQPTAKYDTDLFSGSMTTTANASDALSGVTGGEFYIDTDPGYGHGTPMTSTNGRVSTTTTISSLSIGQHTMYVL